MIFHRDRKYREFGQSMTVIKRERGDSIKHLLTAIEKFVDLLKGQKEDEAIEALNVCSKGLINPDIDSKKQKEILNNIIDAFEGDLELISYTYQREGNQWTEVEELSNASSRVLSLVRRMLR